MLSKAHLSAAAVPGYTIKLFGDANDGRLTWVDFQVIELREPTDHLVVAEGFLKWDGCTQFRSDHVHVDDVVELEQFLAAIREARRLAAEAIGEEYDLSDEYAPT